MLDKPRRGEAAPEQLLAVDLRQGTPGDGNRFERGYSGLRSQGHGNWKEDCEEGIRFDAQDRQRPALAQEVRREAAQFQVDLPERRPARPFERRQAGRFWAVDFDPDEKGPRVAPQRPAGLCLVRYASEPPPRGRAKLPWTRG